MLFFNKNNAIQFIYKGLRERTQPEPAPATSVGSSYTEVDQSHSKILYSVFHLPILLSSIYVGIFKKVHKRQRTDYATHLGIIYHVLHYLMFTW